MSDDGERRLAREAAAGDDPETVERAAIQRCRRGEHEWSDWDRVASKVDPDAVELLGRRRALEMGYMLWTVEARTCRWCYAEQRERRTSSGAEDAPRSLRIQRLRELRAFAREYDPVGDGLAMATASASMVVPSGPGPGVPPIATSPITPHDHRPPFAGQSVRMHLSRPNIRNTAAYRRNGGWTSNADDELAFARALIAELRPDLNPNVNIDVVYNPDTTITLELHG